MEMEMLNNKALVHYAGPEPIAVSSTEKPFIEANTDGFTPDEIRDRHIIPVFVKDNETVISHSEFIDTTMEIVSEVYEGETILKPTVRLSHPIKGRIPEAKHKSAIELLERERTLYYERMAFIIEVPTVFGYVDGNPLSLTVGGVKAYNLDNLYNKKGVDEHFKVFIGFQNKVCTNLCVWSDGYIGDLKVNNSGQLKGAIRTLIEGYNQNLQLFVLSKLAEYSITEKQFAHLIGRCRMYAHLPGEMKNAVNPLLLGDTQINTVVKDYYQDNSLCRGDDGNINLWKLYNLFTGANKSSYIDTFLDRSVNAYRFIEQLRFALENKTTSWYLN
jgi:hypothetical protein